VSGATERVRSVGGKRDFCRNACQLANQTGQGRKHRGRVKGRKCNWQIIIKGQSAGFVRFHPDQQTLAGDTKFTDKKGKIGAWKKGKRTQADLAERKRGLAAPD